MSRQLPFLPGNSFDDHLLKGNHAKRHLFDYKNDSAVINDVVKPRNPKELSATTRMLTAKLGGTNAGANNGGGLGETLGSTFGSTFGENADALSESQEPRWISLDRKVLRFNAYFQEAVHESNMENYRVRKCVIYYYLEDDTIHVSEPRVDNSGISQGALIKRHRIPIPGDENDEFYSMEHLNVGEEVEFYGKRFRIVSCDEFTRKFFETLEIEVGAEEGYPEDAYTTLRAKAKQNMQPKVVLNKQDRDFKRFMEYSVKNRHTKPSREEAALSKQFLANDRRVLQFFCCWDDRTQLNGDFRKFIVTYFLANNMIKISEVLPQNCGRDLFPVFIKKQRVTKPGTLDIYQPEDLGIGKSVTAFSKTFLIYNMDNFTQDYYRKNFGVTDFTPLDVELSKARKVVHKPPPYNGFGTEEDSLGSWRYLVPTAPKKDIGKYMKYDKVCLRFSAKLITAKPEDVDRKFIICFYLADDTLSIFEPAQRNSGIIGGKFLQRCRCRKPDGTVFQSSDFNVGGEITVNHYRFKLVETDERTLNYMESNPSVFEMADISSVIASMRTRIKMNNIQAEQAFASIDTNQDGTISLEELRELLISTGLVSAEQEVITVLRQMDKNEDGTVSYAEFLEQLYPEKYAEAINKRSLSGTGSINVSYFDADNARTQDAVRLKEFSKIKTRVLAEFQEKVKSRPKLYSDIFRGITDRTRDALIGEQEFRVAAEKRMGLAFSKIEVKGLIACIFPRPNMRLTHNDIMKICFGSSTWAAASMRSAGKEF